MVVPPDTEYLYYPLDEEHVTLKGSLLPASTNKTNNYNNNKNLSCWRGVFVPNPDTNAPMIFWKNF